MAVASFFAYLLGAGRSYGYDASVTVGQFVRHGDPWRALTRTYVLNNHIAFSVIESVIWRLGGRSEAALRVLPALCAAITVGSVTNWVTRRHRPLAGVTAGFVAMLVPFSVEAARDVRGYSLVTMCLTIAAMIVVNDCGAHGSARPDGHLPDLPDQPARPAQWDRRRVLVAVAISLAVGTHLFAGIGVLGLVVWALATDRDAWMRWSRSWIVGCLVGLAIHAPTLLDVADVARHRPGGIDVGLPVDTARELLGRNPVAVCLIAIVTLGVMFSARRGPADRAVVLAAVAVAFPSSIMWLVIHPMDLYPRFFGWLVPVLAIAVGSAVGRWAVLVLPVGVAVVAMIAGLVPTWTEDPLPNRLVADFLSEHPVNGHVCAVSNWGDPLMGYSIVASGTTDPAFLPECSALVGPMSDWDTPLVVAARIRMTDRVTFESAGGAWFVLR